MTAVTSNGQSAPFSDDAGQLASSSAFTSAKPRPGAGVWTGRVLTTLVTLFLLWDAYGKLARAPQVTKAFAQMGFSAGFTVLYAVPRTTVLGALFLTGYLGGAVALQWRSANPVFETTFPILFAVVMWAGVFLRDRKLWTVMPVRCAR